QFDRPICGSGAVEIQTPAGPRTIRITRAHLEEDAGKLIHPAGAQYSLVDLNRAGVPLLEIVTEPDFQTPGEAKQFLQGLRAIARYLGVSDADMEKGHLRCDANISMRPAGAAELPNYKVEVKNMNSFRSVEAALAYEIKRQTEALEAGRTLARETRGWSDAKQATLSQRSKEGSDDYRYFPEPDLPILHIDSAHIEELRKQLPELPQQKLARFRSEFGLPAGIGWQIVESREMAEYFEATVSELKEWFSVQKIASSEAIKESIQEAARWCAGLFTELLNRNGVGPKKTKIKPENFAELLTLISKGEISKTAAKQVLTQMFETGDDPSNIIEEQGLKQVSDTGELATIVEKVMADNPKVVEDVRAGKQQAIGFLVGKVMAASKGKANPQVVNQLLLAKLK
ncbi:MAG TPA: Asp-tRNA(Asn)/Glu-tRNA(Gln) amidotransferase subunit GatB, partial [Patescibacteria group bacterium]|nr:Asp-tRNA(Asn)/Glu-tRNA(Gln) amidotransferase subunit GatB [Patescibacteria group bacterium]